jgi:thiosulfate/3-mercaptopyruvate sulfurtransferase
MSLSPLIQATELKKWLVEKTPVVVLDARFDLSDVQAGQSSFAKEHLIGAHYAHLERDLSGAQHDSSGQFLGRHPLPSRAAFAATVASWGITPASQVVVLDDQAAMFAARAWWLLRWLGHEAVAVVDGGMAACRENNLPMTAGTTAKGTPTPSYPERKALVGTVDVSTVLQQVGHACIIDARSGERFRGEVEPLDARAGHIPGARNHPFKNNLDAAHRFKPAALLRSQYLALLGADSPCQAIHQCGSGVTACHNLLAMEVAGLGGGLLYPGSWSQWCADASRPVARG